jgi:hypothetical protein
MPNYVHHNLTITGAAAEQRRFLNECFAETEKGLALDFSKLIPETDWSSNCSVLVEGPGEGDLILSTGNGVARIGMLWSTCFCKVSHEANEMRLSFDAAWAVPYQIFLGIAERFPKLSVQGYLRDGIGLFEGTVHCHGGAADLQLRGTTSRSEMNAAFEYWDRGYANTDAILTDDSGNYPSV